MADELDDVIIDLTDLLEEGQPPKPETPAPDSFDLAKELMLDEEPKADGVKLDVELSSKEEAALAQELMALDQTAAAAEPPLSEPQPAATSAAPPDEAAETPNADTGPEIDRLAAVEAASEPAPEPGLEDSAAATDELNSQLLDVLDQTLDQPAPRPTSEAEDAALLAAVEALNAEAFATPDAPASGEPEELAPAAEISTTSETATMPELDAPASPEIEAATASAPQAEATSPPEAGATAAVEPDEIAPPNEPATTEPDEPAAPLAAAPLPLDKDALLGELKTEIPALLAEVVRPLISSLAAEIVREAKRKLPQVIEQVIREEIEKLKQID